MTVHGRPPRVRCHHPSDQDKRRPMTPLQPPESQHLDYKSLRLVSGPSPDFPAVAWPSCLRASGLDSRTTLSRVEPHRLRGLILEDLERYPDSSSTEIHGRVGPEIPPRTFRRTLEELVEQGWVRLAQKVPT